MAHAATCIHADYAAKATDGAVLQRPLKVELLPSEIKDVFGFPRNLKERQALLKYYKKCSTQFVGLVLAVHDIFHAGQQQAASHLTQWSFPMGRYILGSVLGAGSFGVVREATERKSKRKYAVKTIPKSPKSSKATPRYLLKLQTEADAMGQIGASLDAVFLKVCLYLKLGGRDGGRSGMESSHGKDACCISLHPPVPATSWAATHAERFLRHFKV